MSTVESTPNADEIRKYLKEAGAFEENMNYDDMLSCYQVIKSSENTAEQEEKKRYVDTDTVRSTNSNPSPILSSFNFDDSDISDDEKSATSQQSMSTQKLSKSNFSLFNQQNSSSRSLKYDNNSPVRPEEYDAFECPLLKHKPLDIIFYERKYEIPPYCNPKYSKLNTMQRAKIINDFHRAILKKFYKHHCESLNSVPWGKPIASSEKYGSLDLKSQLGNEDFEFVNVMNEDENDTQEMYTSRSGRQTKRKIYTDLLDDDSDFKKSKQEEDKPFEVEEKIVSKRRNINKLSNQDIMKRSKLFSEPARTRTERMFDALKEQEDKTVNESEPLPGTNGKLRVEDENDIDIIQSSQDTDDFADLKPKEISPFIPRRIPPPLRGRRGIGKRRQQSSEVNKLKSNNSSPAKLANVKSPSVTSSSPTTSHEQSQESIQERRNCPICSKMFPQDEIEAHASSCGLVMETESNFDVLLPNGSVKKMKCAVCDKEMIMNKDYEVHVKDCIRNAQLST